MKSILTLSRKKKESPEESDRSAASIHPMDDSVPTNLRMEDLHWLRALARQLVSDPHLADDAVQDTVLTALVRGPRDAGSLRAWLGAVLRNVLRQEHRAAARRTVREGARESERRPENAPSTLEVVEELSWHRRLVEIVHELDEPYRTTIVLRFLRGMTPRQIAREANVPVKTAGQAGNGRRKSRIISVITAS